MTGSSQVQDGPAYRHEIGYLADQLRQYVDQTVQEMADEVTAGAAGRPELAERLKGYTDALKDIRLRSAARTTAADAEAEGAALIAAARRAPESAQ